MVRWQALVLGAVLACGGEAEAPDLPGGLAPLAQAPVQDGHMMDLVVHGEHVYLADGRGIVVLQREPGGRLVRVRQERRHQVSYTTIAVHGPSATLFAGDYFGRLDAYDLSDPAHPRLQPELELGLRDLPVRDLTVAGDHLLLSAFDRGLLEAVIGSDGTLGALESRLAEPTFFAAPLDRGVAALTTDGRLAVLDSDGVEWLPLDGPPVGLATDGNRIAVAMGSQGVVIVERRPAGLAVLAHEVPPAVITNVTLDGDRLVATALNGVFAYALEPAPRLFGFYPTGSWSDGQYGFAFASALVGDELVVNEWVNVSTFRVDPTLPIRALDHDRGVYLAPGAPVTFAVRNVGSSPIHLTARLRGKVIERRWVEAGSDATIAAAPRRSHSAEGSREWIDLEQRESPSGPIAHRSSLVVVHRRADMDPARGHPAPGEPFPPIGVRRYDDPRLHDQPVAGRATRVVFGTMSCAAMWPELLDADWLAMRGLLDGGADVVLASNTDEEAANGWSARWNLSPARGFFYAEPEPSALMDRNAVFGEGDLYYRAFQVDIPGDAQPTDYLVDSDGIVLAVERMYRGAHPLRPGD